MTAYIRDLCDGVPDIHVHVEAVHRLGNLGAVVTQASAWDLATMASRPNGGRIGIFVFDGDLLSRYETVRRGRPRRRARPLR